MYLSSKTEINQARVKGMAVKKSLTILISNVSYDSNKIINTNTLCLTTDETEKEKEKYGQVVNVASKEPSQKSKYYHEIPQSHTSDHSTLLKCLLLLLFDLTLTNIHYIHVFNIYLIFLPCIY